MFFTLCDTGLKWVNTLFFNRYVVAFSEINVLKEVRILRYLHKSITNTIFQNKAVLNYTS